MASPMKDDWQAKDDARTLSSAEEVRSDSKRHGKATRELRKSHKALSKALARNSSRRGGIIFRRKSYLY